MLRRCDTSPTRSPLGLNTPICAPTYRFESKPSTSTAPRPGHIVGQLVEADPRFVVEYDTTSTLGVDALDARPQRVGHRAAAVEDARGRRVAQLVALARDAVVLGRVPRDERLPHVVVRVVAVLVVGRVEVGEVEGAEGPAASAIASPADRRARARRAGRGAEREALVRPGRPLLQVRHLHAGGGVDAVGGLDQAREQRPGRAGAAAATSIASRIASMRAPFSGRKKREPRGRTSRSRTRAPRRAR